MSDTYIQRIDLDRIIIDDELRVIDVYIIILVIYLYYTSFIAFGITQYT